MKIGGAKRSNDNGRGCSSAGTFVNCRRCPDVANAGWPDAVILSLDSRLGIDDLRKRAAKLAFQTLWRAGAVRARNPTKSYNRALTHGRMIEI
jgi:hypothetical protein